MMLTETAALGLLVSESLGHIVELGGRRIGVHIALQVSTHGSRGSLGLQGDASAALILEGIHLLLHYIRGLAHAALEQYGVLENRGNNLCHIVGAGKLSGLLFHPGALVHPLAVPVFHSSWCLCYHIVSSSVIRTFNPGSAHFPCHSAS